MNVAVVGSYRDQEQHKGGRNRPQGNLRHSKKEFEEACAAIGRKLAEWGHRLVVPHADHDDTAEAHALRGLCAVAPYRFSRCVYHEGDPVLKAHFEAVEMSDAVILIGGLNGTYASGLGALRRKKLIVPIPMFGGSAQDLCEIPEIDNMLADQLRNMTADGQGWVANLTDAVNSVLNAFPRVLIIHGRGDTGDELAKKLSDEARNESPKARLSGIADPLVMNLSGMGALSVPDVFEDLASQVSAAIAIVTADDIGGFARAEGKELSARELKLRPRARENVWVEVGWFWGRLGRQRVFLWLKDQIELPSDLQGAAWTDADRLEKAWPSIEAFVAKLRETPGYGAVIAPVPDPVSANP